jgi:hypothetical protein
MNRIRRNPTKNASNPREEKNPIIEPLCSRIWEGNQRVKNHEGFMTKSQIERPQNCHKKIAKKRLRKSLKRENRRDTIKP